VADKPDRTRAPRTKSDQPLRAEYPASARRTAPPLSGEPPDERTLYRRAVEAAIWGMPIVAFDTMREAFFRDAGATYNDVMFLSKPADWKLQITTPNASSRYVFTHFNVKDGPVVFEIPPAVAAGLFGSMNDAWQAPLADVGPAGDDQGKGGKYLLLPPGYTDAEPAGYFPVRMNTFNGYALLRAIPETSSDADVAKALDLIKKVRLYPLSEAKHPSAARSIDMSGKLFDGIPRYDASFYERLARIVKEETVQERDFVAMGQLRSLGITRDTDFQPDARTKELLAKAIVEAQRGFMQQILRGEPIWPGSHWTALGGATPAKTAFTFVTDDYLDIDARGMTYFLACAPPQKLGAASVYIWGTHDAADEALQGEDTYHLRVPPNVPVKQFWAVTVYDLESAGFIRESPRVELNSYNEGMQKNTDGSVDVYFGPKAPEGKESNWIFTAPGKQWFSAFRFYGPEQAVSDKSWVLPDIETVH
jgi:hypothetical protein